MIYQKQERLAQALGRVKAEIPALNEFHGYAHGVALTDIRIIVEAYERLTPATDDAIAIVAEALAEADGLPSFAKAKVVVAALRRAGVLKGEP